MKKVLLLVFFLILNNSIFAQTLNYAPTWPDTNWTITGSYESGNLLLNPTIADSNFKFDDSQVAHVGDNIFLNSPIIDLQPAYNAGETGIKFSFNVAFTLTPSSSETIKFEWYDADNLVWSEFPGGSSADPGSSVGDYQNCTNYSPVVAYADISGFTVNQQQNFRIRFNYNDGGLSQGKGLCMEAPTVVSLSCNAPTGLYVDSISDTSAAIGWTTNNTPVEAQWNVEYGATGFTIGSGTNQDAYSNPWGINGFAQQTTYDIYVRADCSEGDGTLMSDWSSKLTFTTNATCNLPTNGIAGGITATTADLSWNIGGSETEWDVQYGLQGFVPGSGNATGFHSTNNTSNGISGLSPNTTYSFYVSAHCGTGNDSGWAGPFNFTTTNPLIDWCNLQWPDSGTITLGSYINVYSQIYKSGVTDAVGAGNGINVWIGWGTSNTNPNTWTNWVQANYNKDVGNNDEYITEVGHLITTAGTYYYASRVQLDNGDYKYGGYNASGGGFWDGINNVSGVLTVNSALGIDDQKIEGFNFKPNPIKDKIDLSYKTPILNVEIYNLLGQKVFSAKPNAEEANLNISTLKTGIYILKIKVKDKQGSYKIIKD
ncbi:T9SS type A sorting domain-containing protein [Lutibacter sp.]|uniref:T9SS type A sorting domain-containing protein n=1 Tax=Lutibacter sp. TaxID=1925666 RepID=UPI0025B883C2|nr:T9SS type A sorting domain-containing protein [Lutibacter sp.]MCF6180942.1 T9SS type A sorting domain-containing protein [Lutibacter sp.]